VRFRYVLGFLSHRLGVLGSLGRAVKCDCYGGNISTGPRYQSLGIRVHATYQQLNSDSEAGLMSQDGITGGGAAAGDGGGNVAQPPVVAIKKHVSVNCDGEDQVNPKPYEEARERQLRRPGKP
jgi:hypothetical protein